MDLSKEPFRPCIPVGVNRIYGMAVFEKHIVHAPGVDGEGSDMRKRLFRLLNALFYMLKQPIDVPHQMSVLLCDTVGEPVYFFCPDLAVFQPAHNVPPGGGADVNGKLVFHMLSSQ